MRALILILILACAFGVAAVWQQQRTQEMRMERALAMELAAGSVAMTPSGLLGEGEAVVVIGGPARAPSANTPQEAPPATPKKGAPGDSAPPGGTAPQTPAPLGDFMLEVSPGQSLSQIAHQRYGHAPQELVSKLALYNGLENADMLRSGMRLKLPTLERLGVVQKQ